MIFRFDYARSNLSTFFFFLSLKVWLMTFRTICSSNCVNSCMNHSSGSFIFFFYLYFLYLFYFWVRVTICSRSKHHWHRCGAYPMAIKRVGVSCRMRRSIMQITIYVTVGGRRHTVWRRWTSMSGEWVSTQPTKIFRLYTGDGVVVIRSANSLKIYMYNVHAVRCACLSVLHSQSLDGCNERNEFGLVKISIDFCVRGG